MTVTTDRVQQYQQDGILFPIDLFSGAEIAACRREFDRLDETEGIDRPQDAQPPASLRPGVRVADGVESHA